MDCDLWNVQTFQGFEPVAPDKTRRGRKTKLITKISGNWRQIWRHGRCEARAKAKGWQCGQGRWQLALWCLQMRLLPLVWLPSTFATSATFNLGFALAKVEPGKYICLEAQPWEFTPWHSRSWWACQEWPDKSSRRKILQKHFSRFFSF